MGDRVDLLIPLNQDAMDRHLGLLTDGAACLYNSDTIKPARFQIAPESRTALHNLGREGLSTSHSE